MSLHTADEVAARVAVMGMAGYAHDCVTDAMDGYCANADDAAKAWGIPDSPEMKAAYVTGCARIHAAHVLAEKPAAVLAPRGPATSLQAPRRVPTLCAEIEAANAVGCHLSESTDEALTAFEFALEEHAPHADLQRLWASYERRRDAQHEAEGRAHHAVGQLLAELRNAGSTGSGGPEIGAASAWAGDGLESVATAINNHGEAVIHAAELQAQAQRDAAETIQSGLHAVSGALNRQAVAEEAKAVSLSHLESAIAGIGEAVSAAIEVLSESVDRLADAVETRSS